VENKTDRGSVGVRAPNASIDDWLLRIVVKLHDSVEFGSTTKATEHLTDIMSRNFSSVFSMQSLFHAENRGKILTLMRQAEERDPTYRPRNLLNYFSIAVAPTIDVPDLIKLLRSLPLVETAYVARRGEDPQVAPDDDPKFPGQGYLGAAPDGVGATLVWPRSDGTGVPGADGVGLRLIDMELGWTLDHEDLSTAGTVPLYGGIIDSSRQHGTSVLGVIAAKDNTRGCVGVVPNIGSIQVVSYAANGMRDFANAMTAAIGALSPGDIFLIEAQLTGTTPMPLEAEIANFDIIRNATANGIIVIEPSGNNVGGGSDLDQYTDTSGKFVLRRGSGDFKDSRAIMVGSAGARHPHAKRQNSNFGSRVDCYAWGESVVTTNSTASGSTDTYRNDFEGTSSASAIIAGVAASVQGMAEQNRGVRLQPSEMREILSDRSTGTQSAGDIAAGGTAVDLIGVMPNLDAISREVLNISESLYIRQSVEDDGSLPRQATFRSPDIILAPIEVKDPQSHFGEGSGTENSEIWNDGTGDQDSFLYLRVRNRGGAAAAPRVAVVFWSPLSTLLTPQLWKFVGRTVLPRVPAGDRLTVSEAIRWRPPVVRQVGSYGVIALLGTPTDPKPGLPGFRTWEEYLSLIGGGRLGVRNVSTIVPETVAKLEYPDELEYAPLSFVAPGPPDIGRSMRLEVETRLPSGSRAWLESPPLLQHTGQRRAGSAAWEPVNPSGRTIIPASLFPAGSTQRLRLLVHIGDDAGKTYYTAVVNQFQGDRQVGGITYHIQTPKKETVDPKTKKIVNRENGDDKMTSAAPKRTPDQILQECLVCYGRGTGSVPTRQNALDNLVAFFQSRFVKAVTNDPLRFSDADHAHVLERMFVLRCSEAIGRLAALKATQRGAVSIGLADIQTARNDVINANSPLPGDWCN